LPDVVLYLTVPPEVASSRAAFGAERYETVELQNKVRHKFAKVAAVVTQRHGEIWREIEAVGSIEEVESKVWTEVSACIERGGRRGELWVET
jgi:dTMP kinase